MYKLNQQVTIKLYGTVAIILDTTIITAVIMLAMANIISDLVFPCKQYSLYYHHHLGLQSPVAPF